MVSTMRLFARQAEAMDPMGPALKPPAGVTPDLIHPWSFAREVLATQIIFFVLVPLCVLPRIYTSIFIIRRVRAEECKRPPDCIIIQSCSPLQDLCIASWVFDPVFAHEKADS